MTDGTAANPRAKGWDVWLVRLAMLLGIGAPLAGLAMALLTGAGLLDFSISLGSLRWLSYAAMAGCVLALVLMLLFALRRRWSRTLLPLLTVVIAAAFVGMLSYNFGKAEIVPPIHDVTTDLANPPQFVSLTERADNLDVVPDGGVPQLAAMSNAERWRFFHLREYGDIQPITVPANVQQTVDAARGLVEERGWTLAAADAASGRVEATATVSLYRFKDDVVLRVTPNPNGAGSVVNMRSVSRVGVSDLGVNAERVQSFLADLQARLG